VYQFFLFFVFEPSKKKTLDNVYSLLYIPDFSFFSGLPLRIGEKGQARKKQKNNKSKDTLINVK